MLYKHALGRLFGQFGTWPMNYLEWLRRLATKGPIRERVKAITTAALVHGTILKTMEELGIDASSWVFSGPLAYGGGPPFKAATSLLEAFDFQTPRGEMARQDVLAPIWPLGVPGGVAMKSVYEAVMRDDPNLHLILLGFKPMKPSQKNKGIFWVVPE